MDIGTGLLSNEHWVSKAVGGRWLAMARPIHTDLKANSDQVSAPLRFGERASFAIPS
ncbi:MAG TPA: hypothetical protein VGE47_03835 [Burkholderiaceae bacterium]